MATNSTLRRLVTIAALVGVSIALVAASGCSDLLPSRPPKEIPPTTSTVAPTGAAQTGHQVVAITDSGYKPATVAVKVGSTVVWTNKGKGAHNVTIGTAGPSSGKISPGGTATHVFDKAGTYKYHDSLHPKLTGTIIVQ